VEFALVAQEKATSEVYAKQGVYVRAAIEKGKWR